MRCINNTDKNVTVRKQKIRKNHVREKLIFFTILALILLLAAAFARKLCPYDPDVQDLLMAQKPPSAEHILGTDRYGRDMFSRVLVGSTTSIYATLLLVAIITVLGTVIGIICGWCGGILDTVLMRISDLFLAFPSLVFALAVAGVLGGGIQNAIIALAVIGWPKFARLASCTKRFAVSDGSETVRKHYTQDYVQTYLTEYCRSDSGNICTGHRNYDDGTGRTFLPRTWCSAANGRMGKYDQ